MEVGSFLNYDRIFLAVSSANFISASRSSTSAEFANPAGPDEMAFREPDSFQKRLGSREDVGKKLLVRLPLGLDKDKLFPGGKAARIGIGKKIGDEIGIAPLNKCANRAGHIAHIDGARQDQDIAFPDGLQHGFQVVLHDAFVGFRFAGHAPLAAPEIEGSSELKVRTEAPRLSAVSQKRLANTALFPFSLGLPNRQVTFISHPFSQKIFSAQLIAVNFIALAPAFSSSFRSFRDRTAPQEHIRRSGASVMKAGAGIGRNPFPPGPAGQPFHHPGL